MRIFKLVVAGTITAIVWAVTSYASPTPTATPFGISDEELSKLTDDDIAKTDAHRKELLKQAEKSAGAVATAATDQGASLQAITKANAEAKSAFEAYKSATEAQITAGNKAIASLGKVKKKLHLVGFAMCGLILGIAAFVAVRLPGIGFYVGGAIAIAGCSAVWAWVLL